MKIIVIGAAQSGKSTIAKALAERLDTVATDTSELIVKVETKRLTYSLNGHPRTVFNGSFWDSERDRPRRRNLIATGDALKSVSPTVLVDYCFAKGDICVGVRKKSELFAARRLYSSALVVFVRAPGTEEDSFDIAITDLVPRDIVVTNLKTGGVKSVVREILTHIAALKGENL